MNLSGSSADCSRAPDVAADFLPRRDAGGGALRGAVHGAGRGDQRLPVGAREGREWRAQTPHCARHHGVALPTSRAPAVKARAPGAPSAVPPAAYEMYR